MPLLLAPSYWIELLGEENSEMLVNWPGNAEAKAQ